jgi:fibronectin-binding autotransporter adhesin
MTTPLIVTRNRSGLVACLLAALAMAAHPVIAADISVSGDGATTEPVAKATVAGAQAGTFFDISLPAANSSGVALSANNSGDELSVRAGCVGTTSNFSVSKLILNNSNLSGSIYTKTWVPAGAKTLRLGTGGLVTTGKEYAVLGGNLVIDVGATIQPWAVGPGFLMVFSNVIGSGTINLLSGTVNIRNSNNFAGVWSVASGATLITWNSGGLGSARDNAPTGLVRLEGGTLRFNFDKISYPQSIELGSKGGTLNTSASLSSTLTGRVSNQAGVATAPLKVIANANANSTSTGSAMTLAGDFSGHVGPLVLGSASTGLTIGFAPKSTLSFALGANGVVDGGDTTTTALISAGGAANTTKVEFNGKFVVDLSQADTTSGNAWKLVEAGKLNETYGSSFSLEAVAGGPFIKKGAQWVLVDRSQTWSYDPATGILSLTVL